VRQFDGNGDGQQARIVGLRRPPDTPTCCCVGILFQLNNRKDIALSTLKASVAQLVSSRDVQVVVVGSKPRKANFHFLFSCAPDRWAHKPRERRFDKRDRGIFVIYLQSTCIDLTVTVKNGLFEHMSNGTMAFLSTENF
jgi:hypothetical protein